MAGRKIRDARDASQCLDAAMRSGLSRKYWARDNGVDGRSLNAWHMNLSRHASAPDPALRLVELVASRATTPAPMVLRCGPWELEVASDFDEDLLVRVMQVVSSC